MNGLVKQTCVHVCLCVSGKEKISVFSIVYSIVCIWALYLKKNQIFWTKIKIAHKLGVQSAAINETIIDIL